MGQNSNIQLALTRLTVEQARQQYMDQAIRWHVCRALDTIADLAERTAPGDPAAEDLRKISKALADLFC